MGRSYLLPAIVAFAPALLAQAPAPASQLLAAAQAQARPAGKAVLVAFHASWCGWCKRLEGVLAKPAVKEVMDRHFVIQWLTVQERGPKKELENPGAEELYKAWTGGVKAGIPFYGVLDDKGGLRSSSIRPPAPGAPPENIGYPGAPDEIRNFIALLKEGAPGLTPAEQDILAREFDAARPGK